MLAHDKPGAWFKNSIPGILDVERLVLLGGMIKELYLKLWVEGRIPEIEEKVGFQLCEVFIYVGDMYTTRYKNDLGE